MVVAAAALAKVGGWGSHIAADEGMATTGRPTVGTAVDKVLGGLAHLIRGYLKSLFLLHLNSIHFHSRLFQCLSLQRHHVRIGNFDSSFSLPWHVYSGV